MLGPRSSGTPSPSTHSHTHPQTCTHTRTALPSPQFFVPCEPPLFSASLRTAEEAGQQSCSNTNTHKTHSITHIDTYTHTTRHLFLHRFRGAHSLTPRGVYRPYPNQGSGGTHSNTQKHTRSHKYSTDIRILKYRRVSHTRRRTSAGGLTCLHRFLTLQP